MTERGFVNVEIVRTGDGGYFEGAIRPTTDVKIKTSRGSEVWVPETDIIARKPAETEAKVGGELAYFPVI